MSINCVQIGAGRFFSPSATRGAEPRQAIGRGRPVAAAARPHALCRAATVIKSCCCHGRCERCTKAVHGTNPHTPQQSPGLPLNSKVANAQAVLQQRRTPVKKLVIASMLALFTAAIALPVVTGSDTAFAATKKKTPIKKQKKPAGKM